MAEADNLRAAIDWYAEADDPDRRLQLVADSMILWFEAGHEQEGVERFAEALDSARSDAPARAIALTYWAWLRATLNRDEAAEAATEALDLARADLDPLVEAFALQTLGGTLADPQAAESACNAVFDAARRSQGRPIRYGPTAPDAVRCCLSELWRYRDAQRGLEYQQEALRLAGLEGDRRITAVNSARLAVALLSLGDVDSARTALARARDLVSTRVTARWEDIVAYAEGQLALHEERFDDAEAVLTRLVDSTSAGRALHMVLGAAALTDLLTEQSRLDEARAVVEKAIDRLGVAEPTQVARLLARRARLLRLTDNVDAAETDLHRVEAALSPMALPPERVVWLLESAALGSESERRTRLGELDRSIAATGICLPPWEEGRRRSLEG